MGIFGKIKGILFDEEEVEIPIIKEEKKEMKELPKKADVKEEIEKKKEIETDDNFSERELFSSSKTFTFPEEPFKKETKPAPTRSLNVLDYEKRQPLKEKLNIFSKSEKSAKPFKPSPVISPVYGIIDSGKEINPIEKSATPKPRSTGPIDIDEIRKKAYGTLEDDIERTLDRTIDDFYRESEGGNKTIEELLINDVETDALELRSNKQKLDLLDEIDKSLDEIGFEDRPKEINPDDTVESDLFNLIDSMYEKRKDSDE